MNRKAPNHEGGVGKPRGAVLVVDDHVAACQSMVDVLRCAGRRAVGCYGAAEALACLAQDEFDVVITDLRMPGMSGLEFVQAVRQRGHDVEIAMVTAHASVGTAVEAMRYGAFDYIEKPLDAEQLEQLVDRALQRAARGDAPVMAAPQSGSPAAFMVGESEPMQQLRRQIAQVAATQETVLIMGESGVGKELVARALHAASHRAEGALVSVNCPALSPQLMESELFGHERGAFTSADGPRVGRFELAEGGALLLDEVTEIALPLQAKLLRVLQEKTFERVGSSETLKVDVRIMAATNRDLLAEVEAGRFRQDLYYRLAVLPLRVPPLRERKDDISRLVGHFRELASARLERPVCELTPSAVDLLMNHDWPGNVRELENLITRLCVLNSGRTIEADDVRPWLLPSGDAEELEPSGEVTVGVSLQEMERKLIEATLEHYGGHRARTAEALGIGVRTLQNKLRAFGYAPREKAYDRAA